MVNPPYDSQGCLDLTNFLRFWIIVYFLQIVHGMDVYLFSFLFQTRPWADWWTWCDSRSDITKITIQQQVAYLRGPMLEKLGLSPFKTVFLLVGADAKECTVDLIDDF